MRYLFLFYLFGICPQVLAAHGYAIWGELKYPAEFSHFSYANPDAPKGGELRLVSNFRVSVFDKYNPYTIKGNAPAYLADLMFDSLLTAPFDETGAAYGLLASDVEVSADGLHATFLLRPEARFHNGKPVLAEDVKHSFDTLVGPYAAPAYKTILEEVESVEVLAPHKLRYRFKKSNRELPLLVGTLPVFSRDWGVENGIAKPFDQVITDTPIGSGPYRIGPVRFAKDITYVRDPNYWAKDLNVQRGSYNFERISVKIYSDNTARLEALKAGEFDAMRINSAGDWARRMTGKHFNTGELVKGEFPNKLPTGFQSYVLNTRKPFLQDVRVRQALGLALDYEWMNRQMFYGAYQRVNGLFGNTECAAQATPSAQELALLKPWRGHLPASVWGSMTTPPRTDGDHSLRGNLLEAKKLLQEAGWQVKNGALRNAEGQAMELEYLDSADTGVRVASPWIRNLEKLGIQLKFRSADFALYQQRLQKFDFDVISINYGGSHNPGQEFAEMFDSRAATTENSNNFPGANNPAIDALIEAMVSAKTKADFLPACHALERAISHSYYLIPQWASVAHRMVYNAQHLVVPPVTPAYSPGEAWIFTNWWAK